MRPTIITLSLALLVASCGSGHSNRLDEGTAKELVDVVVNYQRPSIRAEALASMKPNLEAYSALVSKAIGFEYNGFNLRNSLARSFYDWEMYDEVAPLLAGHEQTDRDDANRQSELLFSEFLAPKHYDVKALKDAIKTTPLRGLIFTRDSLDALAQGDPDLGITEIAAGLSRGELRQSFEDIAFLRRLQSVGRIKETHSDKMNSICDAAIRLFLGHDDWNSYISKLEQDKVSVVQGELLDNVIVILAKSRVCLSQSHKEDKAREITDELKQIHVALVTKKSREVVWVTYLIGE